MRRVMVTAIAALVLVALVAGCGASQPAPSTGSPSPAPAPSPMKLHIGYMADIHGGAIIAIANAKGFWKQAGLDVTADVFTSGPPEVEAIAADKLDIAYIVPGAAWMAASGKAAVVTVDSLNTGDFLIAHPKSGIKELKDLRGKKIGVPRGTSGEMILQLALKKAGLTDKDVQLENMDPPAVVTAFIGGQLDAAAIWSPLTTQIKQRVPDATFLADNTLFFPDYSFPQMWVASPKLVQNNPELVTRFLKAFVAANDYRAANMDDAVKLTAKLAQAPEEGLRSQSGTTKWLTSDDILKANADGSAYKWFEGLEGLFVQFGKLPNVVPAKNFVNVDLFAKAKQN